MPRDVDEKQIAERPALGTLTAADLVARIEALLWAKAEGSRVVRAQDHTAR
jgi:hypothetical protein